LALKDSVGLFLKLVPLLFLGVYVAEMAYRVPAVRRVGKIMRPLSSMARLPDSGTIYLTLCLLNPLAATMTLVELRNKKAIAEKEVVVFSLVSGLPITAYFAFFTILPVAIPMLGFKVASIYILSLLLVGIFESGIGIACGRALLERDKANKEIWDVKEQPVPISRIAREAFFSALKAFRRIILILAPILFIVFLLNHSGGMAWLQNIAQPLTLLMDLPPISVELIMTSSMNLVAACGIGGFLLSDGAIGPLEVVLSLMLGGFIYNLGEIWHTLLPYNISFFGAKLGVKVAVVVWLGIGVGQLLSISLLMVLKGMIQ